MKKYTKPAIEFVLLDGECHFMDTLNKASIYDVDNDSTEVQDINQGNPGGGTSGWGGDAKDWNIWE